ncbi:hypothetical protein JJD41_07175 [Oxynema sp. CENA135]|uniref:hypothetical protein n=1 Tax=Oxynema sp. CENA135 TaxID=984206 RepID=UPI00190CA191|nr:hypothetical protein [Oxynema sp. CENA135]MBK4729648.1 hypothetical protein [Oxynema sp. CENA135]
MDRVWLERAEYIAVALAVVGSMLALIYGQALYAIAPISLCLALNLLNRSASKRANRRTMNQLQEQVASIHSVENDLALKVEYALGRLQGMESGESSQDVVTLMAALKQLRSQLQLQNRCVDAMQAQLDSLTEQFRTRPELEQIDSLSAVIVALKQSLDRLPPSENQ